MLTNITIIKRIARCIKQKIFIIYVDERQFLYINNNLKTWIIPGDNLYLNIETKKNVF